MRLAGGVEIDRFHALELLDDLLHYMKGWLYLQVGARGDFDIVGSEPLVHCTHSICIVDI